MFFIFVAAVSLIAADKLLMLAAVFIIFSAAQNVLVSVSFNWILTTLGKVGTLLSLPNVSLFFFMLFSTKKVTNPMRCYEVQRLESVETSRHAFYEHTLEM